MRRVKIADRAGFCFGVSRAIKLVEEGVAKNIRIATLGPIIHNSQVTNSLAKKGVRIINSPEEAEKDETVVIRSHGIPRDVEDTLKELGVNYIDATCPFVKKIHNIVMENHAQGKSIIIVGDKSHPEVIGINGWCGNTGAVIASVEECEKLDKTLLDNGCVVAQTTFEREIWEKITKFIKNTCKTTLIFDTICSATNERQKSAAELAENSDSFIVIGGKNSSNTKKLYDIARRRCPSTFLVEGAWELPAHELKGELIGITAGASTPDWIIKEVYIMVDEQVKNINNEKGDQSFAEALEQYEQSLVALNTGDIKVGKVVRVTPTEVYVDLGYKMEGVIPAEELTDDPAADTASICSVGDEIEVFVIRVSDIDGVKLSKKKIDAIKGWKTIEAASESGEILEGKIIEAVNRGVIVSSNGCRIFVPASLASERFTSDLSTLVGNEVRFKVVNIREDRRGKRAIGSIKEVAAAERKAKADEFWANVEEGKHYTGVVKTLTKFGAFVDIGGVDGLIHITQLSWQRIKDPAEVVKVGDVVDVYIIKANQETNKISLGFRKVEDDPWVIAKSKFEVGSVVPVKVVRLVQFGAFVELIPGIDGLVHISQIANKRINKPEDELTVGQVVDAKITDIDWDKKKIGLSIRALIAPEAPAEEAPVEAPAEEAPATEE
ncbi:MAG: bifunctional 4-hydroxy-3-methylbut-2-enyl diphosphate reductase/30S ribosomal protein S1 [Oscillospiraceae bacterium]|nr:bifunctional 4-hydroxy-3-methylbut-2-enyl diphosphate reductase/30S ribosomal protein S1 [Oscillospiraceae bacterium]